MYTGNLRGHKEFVFRQYPGKPAHIVTNADDFYARLHSNAGVHSQSLYIETYCHKSARYGTQSLFEGRSGVVRNACEDCFITYEPQGEQPKEVHKEEPGLPF